MEQAKITVQDNGFNWWLITMEWKDSDSSTSFGFTTREDAQTALRFAQYCIENKEELKDVTIL